MNKLSKTLIKLAEELERASISFSNDRLSKMASMTEAIKGLSILKEASEPITKKGKYLANLLKIKHN